MKEVKPLNHSIEALLRSARPREVSGKWLTIEVFYTFHKEQLEQERHRRIIEEVLGKVLEKPVKVRFILGNKVSQIKQKEVEQVANITGDIADEELAKAAEEIFS